MIYKNLQWVQLMIQKFTAWKMKFNPGVNLTQVKNRCSKQTEKLCLPEMNFISCVSFVFVM